jgi:fumarate reductase flavoprotein subunit
MFKRAMSWSHLKADPRIVRAFIDKSGDTIRWLEAKGLYFYCVPHSPTDNPKTWHVSKGDGVEIINALTDECKKRGVEIMTNTTAKKLVKGPNDKIAGVVVEKEGKEIQIAAEAVVISTGGFGGNHEMLKKYCPTWDESMHLAGAPNMGEGIMMALEAGAASDGLGMIMAGGPISGGLIRLGEGGDQVRLSLTFFSGEPSSVWVNKLGRRFIDETVIYNYYESINALIRQPGDICYALLDSALIQLISQRGLTNLAEAKGNGPRQRSPLPPGLEKELEALAEQGVIKVSESWHGIAEWIGTDPEVLTQTIEEYNAACDRGYDPVFAKDRIYLQPLRKPPYYALRGGAALLNTLGGIKINEKMEVLDKQIQPVPGLFAAGVDTGGWTSDTYCAALPGTAYGYALNSGRIAGENALKYISGMR